MVMASDAPPAPRHAGCSPAELAHLNALFRTQPTPHVLAWAAEHYAPHAVLTCSFGGASGMVLLDMVAQAELPITIVFLDTNLLFPETYALVEQVEQRYGLAVVRQGAPRSTTESTCTTSAAPPHRYLYDPDGCCARRKVAPLHDVLDPAHAWINGLRRDQSERRATTDLLSWNERYHLLKLCPLAFWSERDVWRYLNRHQVPYNPLLDQGYRSVGCMPCTRPTSSDQDARAGRWTGFAKDECGIHL